MMPEFLYETENLDGTSFIADCLETAEKVCALNNWELLGELIEVEYNVESRYTRDS